MNIRIGEGYDVHRLVKDRKLVLGGVTIPNEYGLLGNSDADCLIHAIIDALFGAMAIGDIGKHFPDTDPKYKDIDSMLLLKEAGNILRTNNYTVGNIDATIICERPKLSPYIDQMRENIAKAIDTELSNISIKATTEEGLGFTGKKEGIAARAVCIIRSSEL